MNDAVKVLGNEIKFYCKKKWGSQARAAKVLDVSENSLSLVINGHRDPINKLMLGLQTSGFDEEHFKKYFLSKNNKNLDALTKKEVIDLVEQQKLLIDQQRELIHFLSRRIDTLVNNR